MAMDQSGGNSPENGGAFEWPSVSNVPKRETNEGLYNQITSLVNASRGSGGGGGSGADGRDMTDSGGRYDPKEDGPGTGGGGNGGWGDEMPPFPITSFDGGA